MLQQRIILIEFNELSPTLLQRWMAEGRLPNFRRFHDAAQVFTGVADTSESTCLEPWIQWYSLHTGLGFDQHGVFNLTDGPRAGHLDIWHALLAAGYRVGNFAGMNATGFAAPGSFYLPDPWCNTERPFPAELDTYQRVVLSKVQENSNGTAAVGRAEYTAFLRYLMTHGLRAKSVVAALRQLTSEALTRQTSWKRAALLDKLQFDLFRHHWDRAKPDFASFFVNSTAHFQHAYFHLLQPDAFDLPAERLDDPVHRDAILYGYQQMDALLGDFFALERQGTLLVLATALSQHPNPNAGNRYYRPRNAMRLLNWVGVKPARLLPVMAQQFSAEFADEAAAEAARVRLAQLTCEGRPVIGFVQAPARTLFFDNAVRRAVPADAQVMFGNQTLPFHDLFYEIPHTKSGAHHPDSVLWFKTGTHQTYLERTSILNVMPTLLDYYGVAVPPDRRGRSMLDLLGIGRFARSQGQQRAAA